MIPEYHKSPVRNWRRSPNHVFPGRPRQELADFRHWLAGMSRLTGDWLHHHSDQIADLEARLAKSRLTGDWLHHHSGQIADLDARLAKLEADGNGDRG